MQTTDPKNQMVSDAILKEISKSIQGLAFGTVTIKVHNSRVVQLEVTQNKRFDDVWLTEGSGI